ncbi:MAG: RnfABCDGE type electron transport complex subunit D [Candidatus Cloacimonetes bacterium]|nr:RnfABCDGE type electron transport complex subunit D [Candidatus Cloacimonadota bacterium]
MNLLKISSSPHLHENVNVKKVMWSVVIALMPALIAAYVFFGWRSIFLTVLGIITAVVIEALMQLFMKKPITVSDGSAVITGLLLSFNLPPESPFWFPIIGSAFAIIIGKQIFGGLGYNPVNPALLGRAFLMASWPIQMTTGWMTKMAKLGVSTISGLKISIISGGNPYLQNLITSATPLNLAQQIRGDIVEGIAGDSARTVFHSLSSLDYIKNLFWGNIGGCIGEVSAAALIIGAAFLVYKHYIEWRIPLSYIGTVAILSWFLGGIDGLFSGPFLFHIFSGGLILGAFFMATDMVTSPVTKKGRLIFGIGCGIITVVIRLWGGYPEGVSYSILIMNIAVPLIDRLTPQKPFGFRKIREDNQK